MARDVLDVEMEVEARLAARRGSANGRRRAAVQGGGSGSDGGDVAG